MALMLPNKSLVAELKVVRALLLGKLHSYGSIFAWESISSSCIGGKPKKRRSFYAINLSNNWRQIG